AHLAFLPTRARTAYHALSLHDALPIFGALEKAGELLAQLSIEKDRLRPSLARAEHIAVREPAARDEAAKIGETSATRDEIGHVDVVRFEARAVERRRHLDLTVHALLAQDRHFGSRALGNEGRCDVFAQ